MNLLPGATITTAVLGFLGVMAWRISEGLTAVSARKILIPPIGMATGFSMFVVPQFRMPWEWALGAFVVGALVLAEPLIRTTKLTYDGKTVMMRRSAAFFIVVVVLALVRYLARGFFDHLLTLQQTAALFFVLAFGMIVRWRAVMYMEYRRITGEHRLVAAASD